MKQIISVLLVAMMLISSNGIVFAQESYPDIPSDMQGYGPGDIPSIPTGQLGPNISKPVIPGIPPEARDLINDSEFVEIYCLMIKWKSGQLFAALDAVDSILVPAVKTAEGVVGSIEMPNISSVRSEATAKVNAICSASTVEEANARLDEFSLYGITVQGEYTSFRDNMSSTLKIKGDEIRARIDSEIIPYIESEKSKAETELNAFGESLGQTAQSDIESEMATKSFGSAQEAQAYAQTKIKAAEANIRSQINSKVSQLKTTIESSVRAKVDTIVGSQKEDFEGLRDTLGGIEGKINAATETGTKQYDQYKLQAFAKRKAVVLDFVNKSIERATIELEANRTRFEEARVENPDVPSIEDILADLQKDKNVLISKTTAATESEDEVAFQFAIDEFRGKWENYRTDMEDLFYNTKVICTKAKEQFESAKSQLAGGLVQIQDIQGQCATSVSEECVKINEFSSRFSTLTSKINDMQSTISSIESQCNAPDGLDPEELITQLRGIEADGKELETYGKALEAEKEKAVADAVTAACTQIVPQLNAAQVELENNDLADLGKAIANCSGKSTEACTAINSTTGEYNSLKTKITSFTSESSKVQALCSKTLTDDEAQLLKDSALYLKAQSEDIKLLSKNLKEKQSLKVSARAVCDAALSRLDLAKKEVSTGIKEASDAINACKGKADEKCNAINANADKFGEITSKAQGTLNKISGVQSTCKNAGTELPTEALLNDLESIRADEGIIKKLVEDLKAQTNTFWPNRIKSGKAFKVIFDVSPSIFDDSAWTGDWRTDQMGTIRGGDTYTLTYNSSGWAGTGYNEGSKKTGTWSYRNGNPDDFVIDLWGRVYSFDNNGGVYDPDYGFVGHLSE